MIRAVGNGGDVAQFVAEISSEGLISPGKCVNVCCHGM